jgi:hypothetical protein
MAAYIGDLPLNLNVGGLNLALMPASLWANPVAATTGAGTAPIDAAASSDGRFLYQVLSTTGQIGVFSINGGALAALTTINGLPLSIQGIVAR